MATAESVSGAGRNDNTQISPEQGGVVDDRGRVSTAGQFEGEVGKGAEDELARKDDRVVDPSQKP